MHDSSFWVAYGLFWGLLNFGIAAGFHYWMDVPWYRVFNLHIGVCFLFFGLGEAMWG